MFEFIEKIWYDKDVYYRLLKKCVRGCEERVIFVKATKHIKTLNNANLKESAVKGGCGECQASCQSACKTSCTVANQKCEK